MTRQQAFGQSFYSVFKTTLPDRKSFKWDLEVAIKAFSRLYDLSFRTIATLMVIVAMATGCAETKTYQWKIPAEHNFRADWAECVNEANQAYIPVVAGRGPRLTLLKDCMENRGYTKLE